MTGIGSGGIIPPVDIEVLPLLDAVGRKLLPITASVGKECVTYILPEGTENVTFYGCISDKSSIKMALSKSVSGSMQFGLMALNHRCTQHGTSQGRLGHAPSAGSTSPPPIYAEAALYITEDGSIWCHPLNTDGQHAEIWEDLALPKEGEDADGAYAPPEGNITVGWWWNHLPAGGGI